MNILLLGYENIIKYFKKRLEDITSIETIFEAQSLECFLASAKDKTPDLAIIDSRLIKCDIEKEINNISHIIPELLIFNKYCQCIQVRRCIFDTPPLVLNSITKIIERLSKKAENKEMLLLKTKSELISVNKKDIVFIESFKGKCFIHTRRRLIKIRHNLKDLEKIVGDDFLRVHRSYLVNMNEVKRVKLICERSYEIEFRDFDKTALMSRYRYQKFKEYMEQLYN